MHASRRHHRQQPLQLGVALSVVVAGTLRRWSASDAVIFSVGTVLSLAMALFVPWTVAQMPNRALDQCVAESGGRRAADLAQVPGGEKPVGGR